MIRDFFEDMPILSSICAIGLLAIVFILVDLLCCKPKPFWGEIEDKRYVSARHSSGVGVINSGKTATFVHSDNEPEKFLMMVRTKDNEIVTVECSPELYYQKEIGQKVVCNSFEGYFTGIAWSLEGVE